VVKFLNLFHSRRLITKPTISESLKALMRICCAAAFVPVIGCSSGTASSGVSDSAVYSKQEIDVLFDNAPEGLVGTYSRERTSSNEQHGFIKCKVKWVYIYSAYTYVNLKGCAWKWIKLTGSWRDRAAAVAATAKSRNMWLWIYRVSSTRFSSVVV